MEKNSAIAYQCFSWSRNKGVKITLVFLHAQIWVNS